ncbi:MAG: glycosyltransferase [Sphingomonas sp.]|uniref:glycosyltransferase n=1 Tax=Sphingomonas sp. TaxID=28214 RepID=UPI000DB7FCC1|nr:glycosyltransferase [Sphingomonas sp.]PZP19136.1 MAG: glycosyltransferase [Sphingomonas hengshuiensis]
MRKVVLTTIGTRGDLHPFIAIALALKARGFHPVMAVGHDHLDECRAAGLDAEAVLPAFDDIRARMGLNEAEAVRQIMDDQWQMLDQVLLPSLESSTRALCEVAEGACAIVASIFALAAPIVCEKRTIPLISIVLQPMAMLSAYDPPKTPDFWMMRQPPVSSMGRLWNRLAYTMIRQAVDVMYRRQVNRVRVASGVEPKCARRLLEPQEQALLVLGTYSEQLGAMPPDALPGTRIVGFPLFDGNVESGTESGVDAELEAFLADGPPPIAFTLGTFAVHGAGSFYDEAVAVAQRLGARAVMLTGRDTPDRGDAQIHWCRYARHSALFPRSAAIVHHGGVGTTGQAMRAGKPQLVVPHMGDQFDHARRITERGLGLTLRDSDFAADRATPLLHALLADAGYAQRARTVATAMAQESGAEAAATAIAEAIDARQAGKTDQSDGAGNARLGLLPPQRAAMG